MIESEKIIQRLREARLLILEDHRREAERLLADVIYRLEREVSDAHTGEQVTPAGITHTEWGVRYGDGEIDSLDCYSNGKPTVYGEKESALKILAKARQAIADGADPADYEPMALVCRKVTKYAPVIDEWEPALPSVEEK